MASASQSGRSAGILLHPTSLPGPYGVGDLGPTAHTWVDWLARAKQKYWQILPLGPTGYGDSPYQSFSSFAGSPYLISPELLVKDGLLKKNDLGSLHFVADRVDFGPVIHFKLRMLDRAWENFRHGSAAPLKPLFAEFCKEQASWLDDYSLFMALKQAHKGQGLKAWPARLVRREPAAMQDARKELAQIVGLHQFTQFLFFRQWRELKKHANQMGVRLIGDVPIFVSPDSADLWANPQFFQVDDKCQPTVVAGVPPDYFSQTGQLWGNPLYHWEKIKATGYAWWIARLKATLHTVDVVRLDHFRGFEAYWEVQAGMPTAEKGKWIKGPGTDLFDALRNALGGLPLIAEDLGLITPEVDTLREKLGLPGMRVLQFAFGDTPQNRFLPHHYEKNTVVYTGTHDNDTTHGWYSQLGGDESDFVRRYLARDGNDIAWDFIRLAWGSVADYAIAPLQDVLSLGSEARLNSPGRPSGNWSWRYQSDALTDGLQDRLAGLTELYSR